MQMADTMYLSSRVSTGGPGGGDGKWVWIVIFIVGILIATHCHMR